MQPAPAHKSATDGLENLFTQNVLIVWKPEYNLGIPIIDEQHRGIVSIINSLFYAMLNRHGEKVLKSVIGMVTEYTNVHFDVEEEILRKFGFPDLKKHQLLHDELRHELARTGSKSLWHNDAREFFEFLKNWWIEHICEKDRIFRDFLFKKG